MRGASLAGELDYKDGRWEAGRTVIDGDLMDIVGIDISKAKFDAALLIDERTRHATFSNTQGLRMRFRVGFTRSSSAIQPGA
jgi:hypothetical protein